MRIDAHKANTMAVSLLVYALEAQHDLQAIAKQDSRDSHVAREGLRVVGALIPALTELYGHRALTALLESNGTVAEVEYHGLRTAALQESGQDQANVAPVVTAGDVHVYPPAA